MKTEDWSTLSGMSTWNSMPRTDPSAEEVSEVEVEVESGKELFC